MVTSKSLKKTALSVFSTFKSMMNIQTHPHVFDVIHQCIATNMLYTNSMTFWENARTFPKYSSSGYNVALLLGRREYNISFRLDRSTST